VLPILQVLQVNASTCATHRLWLASQRVSTSTMLINVSLVDGRETNGSPRVEWQYNGAKLFVRAVLDASEPATTFQTKQ
jgi:hypothetical protein